MVKCEDNKFITTFFLIVMELYKYLKLKLIKFNISIIRDLQILDLIDIIVKFIICI
jgi:hypothetical protein